MTDQARAVLDFVREFAKARGVTPSLSQIAREVLRSNNPSLAHYHVLALEREGHLVRVTQGRGRAVIMLVDAQAEAVRTMLDAAYDLGLDRGYCQGRQNNRNGLAYYKSKGYQGGAPV